MTISEQLIKYGNVMTEHQKMHVAVIVEMSLKQLRIYLAGTVAKEKTGREILAACKQVVAKKKVAA